MKRSGRLRRVFAGLAVVGIFGGGIALLTDTPALAAFPATIKICNDNDTLDTNGGSTDGKNIDVDRSATSSYGGYSNELPPGDCTGNVNDPAKVTIDLTDDGANFTGSIGSAEIGIINDGIDDSQGPWDMGCQNVATISNEAALPPTENIANHSSSTDPVPVRIMPQASCGAADPLNGRVCSDAGSFDDFDAEGIGTNTYNNNLPPGECTNWFPIASTVSGGTQNENNANRMLVDLSNDAEYEVVAFKSKDNNLDTSYAGCSNLFGDYVGGVAGSGFEVPLQFDGSGVLVAGKTTTIKNFLGLEDPDAGGLCGDSPGYPQPDETETGIGIPVDPDGDDTIVEPSPTEEGSQPAWVASSSPDAPLEG